MCELLTATYSILSSFNNEKVSFICFIIYPRGLGFENHFWEIM